MTESTLRGHKIEYINGLWIYSDNRKPSEEDNHRKCGHCKKDNREDGHDVCLGELKGIMNACCGHGIVKDCYVQFLGGYTIRGFKAKIILDILKSEE
jgi:hypothetical protein